MHRRRHRRDVLGGGHRADHLDSVVVEGQHPPEVVDEIFSAFTRRTRIGRSSPPLFVGPVRGSEGDAAVRVLSDATVELMMTPWLGHKRGGHVNLPERASRTSSGE